MRPSIRAHELAKSYKLYDKPLDRFVELVTPFRRHAVFSALKPLSFEIRPGETIGLIGQNGAGKSTLLKLLCGVTQPSSGELETHGTIASILELGTGFHPEFTGRDNAAVNSAILGLSPGQIKEKLPAIIEFSELGAFVDQPVKTYSSGMYMRLAFSVAVNVDPDILVIDEALAVGDGHFQKKCVDKIREFQDSGKTIFFCSHALYFISTLCQRTLWLDHGELKRFGPTVDVVHEYEQSLLEREKLGQKKAVVGSAAMPAPPVRIRDVWFTDGAGEPQTLFASGDEIHLRVKIESDDASQPIHVLMGIVRAADQMQCFAIGTNLDHLKPLEGRHEYDISLKLRSVPLTRGDYSLALFVGDEHGLHVFDRKDLLTGFAISGAEYQVGFLSVDHEWEFEDVVNPRESAAVR